jgi:hypothetical protein
MVAALDPQAANAGGAARRKAAASAPLVDVDRHASTTADRADRHVTVEYAPGLVAGAWDAAAGGGMGPNDSAGRNVRANNQSLGARNGGKLLRVVDRKIASLTLFPMIFVQIMAIGFCGPSPDAWRK